MHIICQVKQDASQLTLIALTTKEISLGKKKYRQEFIIAY